MSGRKGNIASAIIKAARYVLAAFIALFGAVGFVTSPIFGVIALLIAVAIIPGKNELLARFGVNKRKREKIAELNAKIAEAETSLAAINNQISQAALQVAKQKALAKRLSDNNSGILNAARDAELHKIDHMDGYSFEAYCGKLISRLGATNVEVTTASGDQGIDAIGEVNGVRYGVQCKNYSNTVGNRAIQEAIAGRVFYDADKVIVITNNYFTQEAHTLAAKADVLLWDRDYLGKIIVSGFSGENLNIWRGEDANKNR